MFARLPFSSFGSFPAFFGVRHGLRHQLAACRYTAEDSQGTATVAVTNSFPPRHFIHFHIHPFRFRAEQHSLQPCLYLARARRVSNCSATFIVQTLDNEYHASWVNKLKVDGSIDGLMRHQGEPSRTLSMSLRPRGLPFAATRMPLTAFQSATPSSYSYPSFSESAIISALGSREAHVSVFPPQTILRFPQTLGSAFQNSP